MLYQGVHDIPKHNYDEAQKGNYSYLLVNNNLFTRLFYLKIFKVVTAKRWKTIQDDFFDRIAMGKDLKKYLAKLWKRESLRWKIYLYNNNLLKTRFLILDREIKDIEKKAKAGTIETHEQKAILDKYLGFRLDLKKTTVLEYHAYIKQMQKEYKAAEATSPSK